MASIPYKAYIEISKPRIGLLVLVTTTIGFFLGDHAQGNITPHYWVTLFCTLLGTLLSCAGSGALNNYLERDYDKLMARTQHRALPSGKLAPTNALLYGIFLSVLSTTFLVLTVNLLTGFLALMTIFLYTLVYTPLKRISWTNTFVGAIPGALPILGGWAAATDSISIGAWLLFGIMFLWQHPHFYAIAWIYRDDYAAGGFKMLPVVDPDGGSTFRQIVVYSGLLLILSLVPTAIGMSGMVYFYGASFLGVAMIMYGLIAARSKSIPDCRRLFKFSLLYLPIVLALIVSDKGF